jgi:cytochrome c biogenesis protein
MARNVPSHYGNMRGNMASQLSSFFRKFWQLISSIKTGVILLIIVVIVSAAGTIILQRPMTEADEMQRAYSPQMLRILDAAGLTNVFHAWWFVSLLVLVSLSIVAASIERFPNAWRYFSRPYKVTDASFRRVHPTQKQFSISNRESGLATAERVLRESGFRPERVDSGKSVSLFAEKNRLSEMAVYIVHASLLLIFLGGIIDGLFGWTGFISLINGQQVQQVETRAGNIRNLGFAVRCDGAGQENYKDGSPKKWWSKLAVVDNGREVLRKEIVVNDPLVYRGVRFYQASFGQTGQVEKLLLTATSKTGNSQEISFAVGDTVTLDPDTSVRFAKFIPDYVVRDGQIYTASTNPQNPAAELLVTSAKTGKTVEVWLPEVEGFAHNSESPYSFNPRDLKMANFTGLQVSHEPGQWGVWAGCLLMALGLGTAFYLVHMRIWVTTVTDARGGLALWVGGACNKNREAFQDKFAQIVGKLETELKQAPVKQTESTKFVEEHATTLVGN